MGRGHYVFYENGSCDIHFLYLAWGMNHRHMNPLQMNWHRSNAFILMAAEWSLALDTTGYSLLPSFCPTSKPQALNSQISPFPQLVWRCGGVGHSISFLFLFSLVFDIQKPGKDSLCSFTTRVQNFYGALQFAEAFPHCIKTAHSLRSSRRITLNPL